MARFLNYRSKNIVFVHRSEAERVATMSGFPIFSWKASLAGISLIDAIGVDEVSRLPGDSAAVKLVRPLISVAKGQGPIARHPMPMRVLKGKSHSRWINNAILGYFPLVSAAMRPRHISRRKRDHW